MSIRDRLKEAYENVAYCADPTWLNGGYLFQKANLELYVKERQVLFSEILELRPRTVRDCIPKSKLAQYSNYEYNESRELSYPPSYSKNSSTRLSGQFKYEIVKEPWMLSEIDDLFEWFLYYQNLSENDFSCYGCFDSQENYANTQETTNYSQFYESPAFKTTCFEENALKMIILSDRIKQLWGMNNVVYHRCSGPITKDKVLSIFKPPSNNFFLSKQFECNYNECYGWFRNPNTEEIGDFDHLKQLSKSFKEQNKWILNQTVHNTNQKHAMESIFNSGTSKTDLAPNRRLYSAVLQGLSPPTKIPTLKIEDQMTLLTKQNVVEDERRSTLEELIVSPVLVNPVVSASISNLNCREANLISYPNSLSPEPEKFENLLSQDQDRVTSSPIGNEDLETPVSIGSFESCVGTSSNVVTINDNNTSMYTNTVNNSSYATPTTLTHSYSNYLNYNNYQFACHYSNSSNQYNSHYSNSFQNNCMYSNSFSTNVSQIITNRNFQTLSRHTYVPNTYQMPSSVLMLQPNRQSNLYHVPAPQPTNYFTPLPIPRSGPTVPNNFVRSIPPQRTFPTPIPPHFVPAPPSHWIVQNQHNQNSAQHFKEIPSAVKVKVKSKQFKGKTKSHAGSTGSFNTDDTNNQKKIICKRSSCSCSGMEGFTPLTAKVLKQPTSGKILNEKGCDSFDEIVSKTVGAVFEQKGENFLPLDVSVSDDLEIQALEQYNNNSNDNVYQELERQAAEQYEDYSENWRSPPSYKLLFGGFFIQYNFA